MTTAEEVTSPGSSPGEQTELILASSSPRRQELLRLLGLTFQIIPPNLDEKGLLATHPDLSPKEQVLYLSQKKAAAVKESLPLQTHTAPLIIASDTTVTIDSRVLGKPKDSSDAFQMLTLLQDNVHEVWSAITVQQGERIASDAKCSQVWMKPLDEPTRWQYIQTGEPMDKAGGYGIQGLGGLFIHRIEGCYFNVMGMSLSLLDDLFQQLDIPLLPNFIEKSTSKDSLFLPLPDVPLE